MFGGAITGMPPVVGNEPAGGGGGGGGEVSGNADGVLATTGTLEVLPPVLPLIPQSNFVS